MCYVNVYKQAIKAVPGDYNTCEVFWDGSLDFHISTSARACAALAHVHQQAQFAAAVEASSDVLPGDLVLLAGKS